MKTEAKSESGVPKPASIAEPEDIIICPDCGCKRLNYGSHDPCEGYAFWCDACGFGPVWVEDPKVVWKVAPVMDAEDLQRRQVAELVARKDEVLATFRWRGLDIVEEPYTPRRIDQIADIAGKAIDAIEQGAGRRIVRDMLSQIRILTGRV